MSACAPPDDGGSVNANDLYVGLGRARAVVVLDSATDDERRRSYLHAWRQRLQGIEHEAPKPMHVLADFGSDWRLKPGVEPRTVAHRARIERERA